MLETHVQTKPCDSACQTMRWLNRIELLHCSKYVSTTGILMPYICRWMSPESLLSRRFTTKSDVYSFGILLWEMYSDFLEPYCGHTNQEVRTLATSQSTVQPSRIKCIYHVTTAVIKNTKMQKSHFDLMRTQDWDRFFSLSSRARNPTKTYLAATSSCKVSVIYAHPWCSQYYTVSFSVFRLLTW